MCFWCFSVPCLLPLLLSFTLNYSFYLHPKLHILQHPKKAVKSSRHRSQHASKIMNFISTPDSGPDDASTCNFHSVNLFSPPKYEAKFTLFPPPLSKSPHSFEIKDWTLGKNENSWVADGAGSFYAACEHIYIINFLFYDFEKGT